MFVGRLTQNKQLFTKSHVKNSPHKLRQNYELRVDRSESD